MSTPPSEPVANYARQFCWPICMALPVIVVDQRGGFCSCLIQAAAATAVVATNEQGIIVGLAHLNWRPPVNVMILLRAALTFHVYRRKKKARLRDRSSRRSIHPSVHRSTVENGNHRRASRKKAG